MFVLLCVLYRKNRKNNKIVHKFLHFTSISHNYYTILPKFRQHLSRNLSKQAIFAIVFVKTGGYWWVFSRYFIYLRILADILQIFTYIGGYFTDVHVYWRIFYGYSCILADILRIFTYIGRYFTDIHIYLWIFTFIGGYFTDMYMY